MSILAIEIPSFIDPTNPAEPMSPAYAWISRITVDFTSGTGDLRLSIHPSAATIGSAPARDSMPFRLGQQVAPGVTIASLADLLSEPAFASAFATIAAALYAELVGKVPALAGSTQLPIGGT